MNSEITKLIDELDDAMMGHPGMDAWWQDCATIKRRLLSLATPNRTGGVGAEPAIIQPMETAPGDGLEEPEDLYVHEGAWARVIGTNGKPAGWIDTNRLFAKLLYRDQILPASPAIPADHVVRVDVGSFNCGADEAFEKAANVAYRVCAETRHVTLGDKAAEAIRALKSAPASDHVVVPSEVLGNVDDLHSVAHALEIGGIGTPYRAFQGSLYCDYQSHRIADFQDYGLALAATVLFNNAKAIKAALSAPAGWIVKPLEWDRDVGWPRNAETPFGQYKIWAGKDVWFGREWLRGMHAPTIEDAERWAQEDYEQRIRSALIAPPSTEGDGK